MGFFDRFTSERSALLQRAFADVQTMLTRGHEMFAAAAGVLCDNEILEVNLEALDHQINDLEGDLRRAVHEHLTIAPSRELVFSLKLISIVHEAERVGDLTKSLAQVARLAEGPRLGPLVAPLRSFRTTLLHLFEELQISFQADDEDRARRLMLRQQRLKAEINDYLAHLATHPEATANEAVVYALGARMMSRIGSHLANIASTVALPFDQIRRTEPNAA